MCYLSPVRRFGDIHSTPARRPRRRLRHSRRPAGGEAAVPLTFTVSRGVSPEVLAGLEAVWRGRADLGTDALRVAAGPPNAAPGPPTRLAVLPLFEGDRLVALLYLDGEDLSPRSVADFQRLLTLSRALAGNGPEAPPPADGWGTYLERTPLRDLQRAKLVLLLERNEWNISRVARILGVTRRTIYLRLQRYEIPRQHVRKGPARRG
jgi:hypothetical protein